MKKLIIGFFIAFLLALVTRAHASEIRMLGLGDPWLIVRDADTDWQYNPAYLEDAQNQVYANEIFGFSNDVDRYYSSSVNGGGFGSAFYDNYGGYVRNHTPEAGAIGKLGKVKLALRGSFNRLDEKTSGDWINWDGSPYGWTQTNANRVRDYGVSGALAVPLTDSLVLGASMGWKRHDTDTFRANYDGLPAVLINVENRYQFHEFTAGLGVAWQVIPKLRIGLATDGGFSDGHSDIILNDTGAVSADSGEDYDGGQARVTADAVYAVNDRLSIPVVVQYQWNNWHDYAMTYNEPRMEFLVDKRKSSSWDVLVKPGVDYVIDPASNFHVSGSVYYSHGNDEMETAFVLGGNNSSEEVINNTVGVAASVEKEIIKKLTLRTGLYYEYGFLDYDKDYTGFATISMKDDSAYSQILGCAIGLTFAPTASWKIELAADIPIINKHDYYMVSADSVWVEREKVDKKVYRIGAGVTYLF